jgi:nucleoside-diphosphate-sugar epimerase
MILKIIQGCNHKTYNICGDKDITIKELADILGKYSKKIVEISDEKNLITKYAAKSVNLSLERYFSEFGKHEFVDIEDGLFDLYKWYKMN